MRSTSLVAFALLATVQGLPNAKNLLVKKDGSGVFPWMNQKYCAADSEFYEKDIQNWLPRDFHKKFRVNQKFTDIQNQFLKKGGKSLLEYAARYESDVADSDLRMKKPYDSDINQNIFEEEQRKKKKEEAEHKEIDAEVSELHALTKDLEKMWGAKHESNFMELDPDELTGDSKPEPTIESWYVNLDKSTDRKDCMERQLKELKQTPNRFPAVKFPDECVSGDAPEHCLKQKGFGDCFENGIDYDSISTHGSKGTSQRKMGFHVIANWCSHKRLFEQLEKKKDQSDYFLILEDDVILDRNWTVKVLKDFAQNYPDQSWNLLQVDPFGAKSLDDLKGHFKGKPVWAPSNPVQTADACKQYWGFQAVLIRSAGLPTITEWMRTHDAVPIDWLPTRMPNVLAYGGLIARNPEEASNFGRFIAVPDFCAKSISKSTIAAREGRTRLEPQKRADGKEARLTRTQKDIQFARIDAETKQATVLLEKEVAEELSFEQAEEEHQAYAEQRKTQLKASKARLAKLTDADAKMVEYLHTLWAQAAELKGDEAFEKELKDVERYVEESGKKVSAAKDEVSLLQTATESNAQENTSEEIVMDAGEPEHIQLDDGTSLEEEEDETEEEFGSLEDSESEAEEEPSLEEQGLAPPQ